MKSFKNSRFDFSILQLSLIALLFTGTSTLFAQSPEILKSSTQKKHYLPDFSYAGYNNGLQQKGDFTLPTILSVNELGAIPNDGKDDSKALINALVEAGKINGPVVIQFPPGEFILSEILYITRSNIVLRGSGSGDKGTVIYCPRPMKYIKDPTSLQELREYLVEFDKQQREKDNNIDLPFSQYSWSGGMIWVRKEGTRVKSYLPAYSDQRNMLADVISGERGALSCTLRPDHQLKVGEVVQLEWYNRSGESGSLIDEIYGIRNLKIGSHHWNFPDEPLVKQQVRITAIKGNKITISSPLLLDAKPEWYTRIAAWEHLENVGIEHLSIKFPLAETIAHHVEEGFNAIYLTRLYDGWVNDVRIINSDAAVLTEEAANLTISEIQTSGSKLAHYSVYIGGVHNVLVDGLRVENQVRHPLSFNTFSTKSVFKNCEVLIDPILDQHSGANHQNLFDNIKVHISLNGENSYPLFAGGGAGYWKPSHGSFNTFWNVQAHFMDGLDINDKILLNGMKDGPNARVIGVKGNLPVSVDYGPDAYIEWINKDLDEIESLYQYQLEKRLKRN